MPFLRPETLKILDGLKLTAEQQAGVMRAFAVELAASDQARVKKNIRQAKWREREASRRRLGDASEASTQSSKINGSRVGDSNNLPFLPPSNSVNNSETPTPGVRVVASKKSTRPQRLPEGWQPSDEDREKLISEGATSRQLDFALKAMADWAEAKGITRASWPATYRGFVRRDLERQSTGRTTNGQASIIGHNQRVIAEYRRRSEANERRRAAGEQSDLRLIQGGPSIDD